MKLIIGNRYNWKNQQERLIYVGKTGIWHQFALVTEPEKVWCEVLDSGLELLEPTPLALTLLDKAEILSKTSYSMGGVNFSFTVGRIK